MHRQQALSYTLVIAGVLLVGITAGLRMFETLGDKPAAASQKNRRGPQVAAFYEACIVHVAAPRIKAPSVQQAFCDCYTEEAKRRFEPQDYSIMIAALSGDQGHAETEIYSLSRSEQMAFTKRMKQFMGAFLPHCTRVGLEAAEDARNSL